MMSWQVINDKRYCVMRAVLKVLKSARVKNKIQKRQKVKENLLKILFFLILKVAFFNSLTLLE